MEYRLLPLPGTAWPALPTPRGLMVWSAYRELGHTQWLSPDELRRMQLRQVTALLRHSVLACPYYKDVLTQCRMGNRVLTSMDELRQVPILTRESYRKNFKGILATQLPPGMRVTPKPMWTSGTNGVPIGVRTTDYSEVWWTAFCMRDLEWSRIDPRRSIAGIRLIAMSPAEVPEAVKGITSPEWVINGVPLFESAKAYGMDVRQDPGKQLAWLREIRAPYLISLPSNLEVLANLSLESGRELRFEAVQSLGEPLTPEVRELVGRAFGARVVSLYSTTEAGYMATECPDGHGFHVHAENILAEVLREDGTPCEPGETGRLVFTALHNYASPFIRYDVMDDVTLGEGPCPCGRGLPLWTRVDGRRHPMLLLPDGTRKASTGMMLAVRQIGGCKQFQVVQKSKERIVVRIVPDTDWSDDRVRQLKERIPFEFGWPVTVDVEVCGSLERPNGKTRIVVVEVE